MHFPDTARFVTACAVLSLVLALAAAADSKEVVEAWTGSITIPTYPWHDDVNPVFEQLDGKIYYPYTRQDHLGLSRTERTYKALFLENEYLKVTCLPELGGRIHCVLDKTTGAQMFHQNDEIKPALIAMRGAWISGGIEWNVGPQGHTVTIVSPVDATCRKNADGSATLVIGNTEKMFRTRWTVCLTLPAGKARLDEQIRLFNPTDGVHPYYFWNCTAFPNRPGTRFIYPMTLGCDHAGTSFFAWPIDQGRDMTWLKNYPTMSSVFAYECEYDFFGAYDVDRDRGIVSYANHHELKGKKAWTWGQDPFGVASQMALSDAGPEKAPYIEVQSGPLLTQAEYGMLGPREEVRWNEFWYPVHGLGDGFEFATSDVAVQTARRDDILSVTIIATAPFPHARCRVTRGDTVVAEARIDLSPLAAQTVDAALEADAPATITVSSNSGRILASFVSPLPVPRVEPPDLKQRKARADGADTVGELFTKAWLADSQSQPEAARAAYQIALESDPQHVPSLCALAELDLEQGRYQAAAARAQVALRRDPVQGTAWYLLGVANLNRDDLEEAASCGYQAARQGRARALGYNLVGRARMRQGAYADALAAFTRSHRCYPEDTRNRDQRLMAMLALGNQADAAAEVADLVQNGDPTNFVVRALDALINAQDASAFSRSLRTSAGEKEFTAIEVATLFADLGLFREAGALLAACCTDHPFSPLAYYYLAYYQHRTGSDEGSAASLVAARKGQHEYVFPSRVEARRVLDFALEKEPRDGLALLLRGHLAARLRAVDAAVGYWEKAVALVPSYSEAWRLVGRHAWTQSKDLRRAETCYRQALAARPDDQVLFYDLANILAELDRRPEAIALLEAMPDGGEPRYDVCLWLAGAYNAQQRYDDSIEFLSQVEFSNWEGSTRPRDLWVAALMARGRQHYAAGRLRAARADFETALTYPPNLHVGRQYQRTDAETCYWLGKSRLAGGDARGAREAFRAGASQVTKDDLPLPSITVTEVQDEYVGRCAAALDVLAVKTGP